VEFIFLLLLVFFFIVLYVIPAAIGIALLYIVIKFIVNKFSSYGEPNDLEICSICQDSWCKHDP
jgi:hypothetical protein